MGCAPSKQSVCRNCHAQFSPARRSSSAYAHRSPPRDGENHHVVALTSTTLGYLLLESSKQNQLRHDPEPVRRNAPEKKSRDYQEPVRRNAPERRSMDYQEPVRRNAPARKSMDYQEPVRRNAPEKKSKDYQEPVRRNAPEKNNNHFGVGIIEAETWSNMITEKVAKITPKTPIETPPGEPETINAWELMEDLDDTSPLRPPSTIDHIRCFSFNLNPNSIPPHLDQPTFVSEEKHCDIDRLSKPLWLHIAEHHTDSNSNSNDTRIPSDFDPDSIPAFRNSFEILPPTNPYHPKPLIELQNKKNKKLILYFTSLRGIRKTYEDCCHVRVILKNSGVRVDERDVSMHSGFREELKELLGDKYGGGGGLPKVFVGKKYVGGADEIRRLHDDFQLEKVFEGCEMAADGGDGGGGGGGGGGCEACGDIRFFLCEKCSGSCKIYYEVNSDDVEKEEDQENDYGFQRCPDCNENGLVRCPICCD